MLDVQNPIQTAMTGLTQGMQIGQFMQAKEQAEREAIQKQQMQQELSAFASKPNKTHDDYANIMVRFPSLAEDFKRSYDVLDSGKQQATFKTTSRVYAALSGGQPNVAKSILENEALGYENAGDEATADQIRTLAGMAETDPDGLLTISGLTLASTMPSQFKDVLGALGQNQMLPEEINLKKAQAEKTKADTAKTNAETTGQIIDNRYKPQQIEADLENVNSQISSRKANDEYQQQQLFFEKNKPVDFGVDKEGRKYAIMPNGEARYVKDVQGNYITDIKSEKPMTATMQKELFETDDAIASSQSVISNLKEALRLSPNSYDGVGADKRASLAGNLGFDKDRAKNTAMLNNIVTTNALDALKSIFGAAPTEGERKILLDIQGSVNLPAKQREAIYTRALQAANKRLGAYQKKADAIRGGSYTSSEYNNATAPQQQQASKPIARSFFD